MFASPGRGKNQYNGRNGRRRYISLSCDEAVYSSRRARRKRSIMTSVHTKTTIIALTDKVTGISLFLQRDSHWHRQRKNRFISYRVRAPPGGDVTDEALSPKIKSIRLTEV